MIRTNTPAVLGGTPEMDMDPGDIFDWPIVTKEDEDAVLDVIRRGAMSAKDVTAKLEQEYAKWQGSDYALGFNNGTAALLAAMWAVGVRAGDEIIAPSITYWASALPCFNLGATVRFAEIHPETLCIDPDDIEQRITARTKAIVVVHYCAHPADMDRIMPIADKHGIPVIEDVSHAHGGLYKGRKVGTFGAVAAMSLMSGKSLAIGEAGMLTTNDYEIYERGIAWGHYSRFQGDIRTPELRPLAGLPLGGFKNRMHQVSAAMGRVQLRHYDDRAAEIRKAMNHFWDLLEGTPGIRPHRVDESKGYTMAGWYAARGHYVPSELGGLSVTRFAQAVRAEGVSLCSPGANLPMHLHPLFNTYDVYGRGKPTRIAEASEDLRQPRGSLPVSEGIGKLVYKIPWFKRYRPDVIERHAAAFKKVATNYELLLKDDPGDPPELGGWHLSNI